jgi:hypothetical protein
LQIALFKGVFCINYGITLFSKTHIQLRDRGGN